MLLGMFPTRGARAITRNAHAVGSHDLAELLGQPRVGPRRQTIGPHLPLFRAGAAVAAAAARVTLAAARVLARRLLRRRLWHARLLLLARRAGDRNLLAHAGAVGVLPGQTTRVMDSWRSLLRTALLESVPTVSH